VVSAATGPPYASETKLVQPLLESLHASGAYVLGDKGFDSRLILAAIIAQKCRPVIAIKTRRHHRIVDPLRIRSKKSTDNPKLYKKRTLIEGLFGNVKQKLSSHIRVFKLPIAQLFALLRLALFNIAILISMVTCALVIIWFSNSPTPSE
jgi:Transposase DDE domain